MKIFEIINKVHAKTFAPVTQIPEGRGEAMALIVRLINWALYLAGGLAVIYIVYAGIMYITAGEDQAKADAAKSTITYAIIGIVVIALSFVIINWTIAAVNVTGPVNF